MSGASGIAPEWAKALGLVEGFTIDDASGLRGLPVRRVVDSLFLLAMNKTLSKLVLVPMLRIQARLYGSAGLAGQLEAILAHDTFDRLWRIDAPTLVITGTADRAVMPSSSDELANKIPNAKLVKIHDGSHVFFVEKRGEFNREVLNFVKGN